MTDLRPITRVEMLSEIEREIAMRRRVYPRLIADKKMQQATADRMIAVMEAVAKAVANGFVS